MVTAVLIQKFVNDSYQQRLHEAAGKHYLAVVDPASLSIRPVFPNEDMVLLAGCFAGALIPFGWRRLRGKSFATWGFAIWTVVFGFAGLLAANVSFVLFAQGDQNPFSLRYRSTATVFVQNGSPQQIQVLTTDATSHTALSAIIDDPRLNRNLAINPSGQYLTISFEYPDRHKAQQTVHALTDRLDETYERLYGTLPDEPAQAVPTVLKVLDVASMPALPVSPDRYAIAMKGGLAGSLAAGVIATVRRRWKPEPELPVDAVNG